MDAIRDALDRAGPDDAGPADTATGEKDGVFVVTHADEDSAVLRDVDSGQVHALSSNPGVDEGEVVEGVVAPDPPMNVSWQLIEVHESRYVPVEESEERPTRQSLDLADDQAVGELTRTDRAGDGELHVITVPEGETDEAVADVLADDDAARSRAARLGVNRVEIRSAPGVVVVRYMP
ncbi:DUF5812 family protein [Halobaculum sp. CBA1158]|uniref:DUF5812 family protein n=1 Tax=Halobaculum sp. CBA1158 TaxID=2904243 RepID=UPI001F1ABD2E|nr:DUF5812 family protein [Halobaculum sp. CBA1158]UIP01301.1 DUF5812 family protein [Halobaculum sp. CBA1158]